MWQKNRNAYPHRPIQKQVVQMCSYFIILCLFYEQWVNASATFAFVRSWISPWVSDSTEQFSEVDGETWDPAY